MGEQREVVDTMITDLIERGTICKDCLREECVCQSQRKKALPVPDKDLRTGDEGVSESNLTYGQKRYRRLRDSGRCTRCGKPNPDCYVICQDCRKLTKMERLAKSQASVFKGGVNC